MDKAEYLDKTCRR
jgi:hypothetical protein